ncbi:MAG: hypothetical protein A2014_10595 [Spirochaetes bacterium GWF1_49_6]|nr:MAG: hypothetical protein A2014_10595 [Spirochaetes bacterium GWF1_49_6]
MIILHGKYDHGRIEIEEKELPEIETDIEIRLTSPQERINRKELDKIVGKFDFGGRFDHTNIRDMIYD